LFLFTLNTNSLNEILVYYFSTDLKQLTTLTTLTTLMFLKRELQRQQQHHHHRHQQCNPGDVEKPLRSNLKKREELRVNAGK